MKKQIITGLVGVVAGAGIALAGSVGGQTISIQDDGVHPTDFQKVTIQTTAEVTNTDFEGTLSDIRDGILPNLYKKRDAIDAEIAKYEALQAQIEAKVNKLPPRKEAESVSNFKIIP